MYPGDLIGSMYELLGIDGAARMPHPQGQVVMPCELSMQVAAESYELNSGTLSITANVGTP